MREGFEPSELFELGALAKLCFQPLSHLTVLGTAKLFKLLTLGYLCVKVKHPFYNL